MGYCAQGEWERVQAGPAEDRDAAGVRMREQDEHAASSCYCRALPASSSSGVRTVRRRPAHSRALPRAYGPGSSRRGNREVNRCSDGETVQRFRGTARPPEWGTATRASGSACGGSGQLACAGSGNIVFPLSSPRLAALDSVARLAVHGGIADQLGQLLCGDLPFVAKRVTDPASAQRPAARQRLPRIKMVWARSSPRARQA